MLWQVKNAMLARNRVVGADDGGDVACVTPGGSVPTTRWSGGEVVVNTAHRTAGSEPVNMAQQHPPRPALSEDEIKQVFAVLHLQSEEQREAMAFEAATPGRGMVVSR